MLLPAGQANKEAGKQAPPRLLIRDWWENKKKVPELDYPQRVSNPTQKERRGNQPVPLYRCTSKVNSSTVPKHTRGLSYLLFCRLVKITGPTPSTSTFFLYPLSPGWSLSAKRKEKIECSQRTCPLFPHLHTQTHSYKQQHLPESRKITPHSASGPVDGVFVFFLQSLPCSLPLSFFASALSNQ